MQVLISSASLLRRVQSCINRAALVQFLELMASITLVISTAHHTSLKLEQRHGVI